MWAQDLRYRWNKTVNCICFTILKHVLYLYANAWESVLSWKAIPRQFCYEHYDINALKSSYYLSRLKIVLYNNYPVKTCILHLNCRECMDYRFYWNTIHSILYCHQTISILYIQIRNAHLTCWILYCVLQINNRM